MNSDDRIKHIIYDEKEEPILILGEKSLDELKKWGSADRTVMILTDRRLYINGKKIVNPMGSIKTNACFNVSDITGTIYYRKDRLLIRILLVLLIIATVITHLLYETLYFLSPIILWAFLIYLARDVIALNINMKGSEFLFQIQGYSKEEIEQFRKAIALISEE